MNKTRRIARSSVTGRFTKESYAKKHPKTTEIERIRIKKPNK
jgi:hypothetical protein